MILLLLHFISGFIAAIIFEYKMFDLRDITIGTIIRSIFFILLGYVSLLTAIIMYIIEFDFWDITILNFRK